MRRKFTKEQQENRYERRKRLKIRKARFQRDDKVYCITGVPNRKIEVGVIYTVGYNYGGTLLIRETNEHIHHCKFISLMEYRILKLKKISKKLKKLKKNDTNSRNGQKTL
jgi:hypothetical protein